MNGAGRIVIRSPQHPEPVLILVANGRLRLLQEACFQPLVLRVFVRLQE